MNTSARALSRTPPSVPRDVLLAFAQRGSSPIVLVPGLPPGPVCVIAPHPDDETIGCGGTIARHVQAGAEVRVLVVTSGERLGGGAHGVARAREAECVRACARLGVQDIEFLRLPDGAVAHNAEDLQASLRAAAGGANTLYAPSPFDSHPDHRATSRAALTVAVNRIYLYEISTPNPANVMMDVSRTWPQKVAALNEYSLALEHCDYRRTSEGLAAFRAGMSGLRGIGFAEAFLEVSGQDRLALSEYDGGG